MKDVSIVIPTYNERENIAKLIPHIEDVLSVNNIKGEIIIIDDNSPDRTGKLAEELNKRYKNIIVIHRDKKQGVGSARKLGFSVATKDVIISMEGDNTNNPEYIPQLIKKIEEGADLVIGSRYLKESKIINWPLRRRIISKVANFIARLFAGSNISDVTCGYRAFKKSAYNAIYIESYGYAYNMEMACELQNRGFKFAEIPIVFRDRLAGSSKMQVNKEFFSFLATAFKFSYIYRPLYVFGSTGGVLLIAGILVWVYLIIFKVRGGLISTRIPMVAVGILLILFGIQVISIGLIASILKKFRKEMLSLCSLK